MKKNSSFSYIFISYYFLPNLGGIETSIDSMALKLKKFKKESIVITSRVKRNSNKILPTFYDNGIYKTFRINTNQKNKIFSLFLINKIIFGLKLRRMVLKLSLKKSYVCVVRDQFSALFLFGIKNIKILSLPPSISFHESFTNIKVAFLRDNSNKSYLRIKQLIILIIQGTIGYFLQYMSLMLSDQIRISSYTFKKRLIRIFPSRKVKESKVINFPLFKDALNKNKFKKLKDNNLNEVKFITVSRLAPYKFIDMAIKAVSKLKMHYNLNIKYDIYGSGEDFFYLNNLIKEFNIQDDINIIKGCDDSEINWKKYDFFLFTSICESYGNTLNEAISQELPIVGFQSQANNRNFIARTATSEILGEGYKRFNLLSSNLNKSSLYNCLVNALNIKKNNQYNLLLDYLKIKKQEIVNVNDYVLNIINMDF